MKQNESVEFFLRFLKERHSEFTSAISNLLATLVESDKEKKKKASQTAIEAGINLKKSLSNQDAPEWLVQSINSLNYHITNFNSGGMNNSLLNKIIPIMHQIKNHEWKFESSNSILAFDFDSIYETCKKESKLDELFEHIISLLQKLIKSDEIDSIKINSTLEKIIATLRKHNNASYLSLYSMLDISQNLVKNIIWEQLKAVPILGPIVKGVEKTVKETDIEMSKLQNDMKEVIKEKFNSDFKLLEYNTSKILE